MQTRAEFLSTGLVPVDNTSTPETDDCAICMDTLANPVRLPCGHIFDRDCIATWLCTQRRNTCPLDQTKFFQLPSDEDLQLAQQDRRAQVAEALRASGLVAENGLAGFLIVRFGASSFSVSDLRRATANATSFLASGDQDGRGLALSRGVTGPAVISLQHLAAPFVAMGNMIPALAAVQGRAYDGRHDSDWKLMLEQLWATLKAQQGEEYHARALPAELRRAVSRRLKKCSSDVENMAAFFRYDNTSRNGYHEDLDTMLRYLTMLCWHAAKEAQAQKTSHRGEKKTRNESGCSVM